MKTFYLGENKHGVPFVARYVTKGESYLIGGQTKHTSNEPLLQFYDARFVLPSMASSYYLETLRKRNTSGGLDLDGRVPEWELTEAQTRAALEFADRCED